MKAVVLAAGEGTRLRPLTITRPKHMIKIGGRPILEYCIDALKKAGITEIIIVIRYRGDLIKRYFGDGSKFGLRIEYAEQKDICGTGNAVETAQPFVKEEFAMLYGDLLFVSDAIKKAVNLFRDKKPAAVVSVVPTERPEEYGIVELDEENQVKRIVEKPKPGETSSTFANAGIYVFSPMIFEVMKKTTVSARGEWEITDALSQLLTEKCKILATKLSDNDWFDIGRPWDLIKANRWVLDRGSHRILGIVENGATLIGPVTVEQNARIRSGVYIEGPAFVGNGSDIGPNCFIRPYTSIAEKVRIGNACEIKESIIMDGVHIGHLSYVGDSILGEKCNLGAGTVTGNYRLKADNIKMLIKDSIVDTGRRKLGAVLGDNVKTGIGALLMPGVKIGVNSWIGPNVVVYRDLQSDSYLMLKQNVEEGKLNP